MSQLTIVANGQTLSVDVQCAAGDAPGFAEVALSTPVNFPTSISSDTTYYFDRGTVVADVTVTTGAGAVLHSARHVFTDSDHVVLTPLPTESQQALSVSTLPVTALASTAITYDHTVSGMTATNVKTAIDELHAHVYPSSVVTYDHTISSLAATNVKTALDEIVARIVALETP